MFLFVNNIKNCYNKGEELGGIIVSSYITEFVVKNKRSLFFIIIFFIINIISSLPLPYLSKIIIDDIIIPKNYEILYKVLLIFLIIIIIIIIQVLGNYISNYLSIKLIQNYIYSLKKILYNKIFNSKVKFNNIDIGNSQTILTNDTSVVAVYSYSIFWSISTNIVLLIAYSFIMFAINNILFLINVILMPFVVYVYMKIGAKIEEKTTELQLNKDSTSTVIYENLFNSREVKVNDIFNFRKNKINTIFNQNKQLSITQNKLILIMNTILSFVISIAPIIIFIVGITFIKNGKISIGELITFVSYQGLMFSPIQSLMQSFSSYKILVVSYNRLKYFLEETRDICKTQNQIEKNNEIIINNFSVKFPWGDSLSVPKFSCREGDLVYISGNNGVGKSLFANILSGLTDDCLDLVGKLTVPKKLSLLTGESIIYTDSLINNVLLGEKYDIDKLDKIINMLNIKTLIANKEQIIMPVSLSSGEKEKIIFARELYREPKFIIADEAFSSIDKKTRNNIIKYCLERKISLIIISHYDEILINLREVKQYKIEKENKNIYVEEV